MVPNLILRRDERMHTWCSRKSTPSSAGIAAGLSRPGLLKVDEAAIAAAPEVSQCWCYDSEFDEQHLVRLGAHQEVGVCVARVRDLQLRADEMRDLLKPSLPGRLSRWHVVRWTGDPAQLASATTRSFGLPLFSSPDVVVIHRVAAVRHDRLPPARTPNQCPSSLTRNAGGLSTTTCRPELRAPGGEQDVRPTSSANISPQRPTPRTPHARSIPLSADPTRDFM